MLLTQTQMQQMSEEDLRKKVLIPLFKAMGYLDVMGHHGGSQEQGKDIVMWKPGDFRDRVNYAVVVKAAKISGKAKGKSSAAEVRFQVDQALGLPFKDPVTTEDREVDRCIVVCPHEIPKEALTSLHATLKHEKLDKLTEFLHGDNLWEMVEELLVPPVLLQLEAAQEALVQACPQFDMTATLGAEGVRVEVKGKQTSSADGEPLASGRFEISDDPEGREIAAAIEEHLATGAPARVPGKFVTDFNLPDEITKLMGLETGALPSVLELRSKPPQRPLLLRMEVYKDGKRSGHWDYLDLRARQAGLEEVTLTNEDQPIPYKLTVTASARQRAVQHSWRVEHAGANVHIALEALRFHRALAAGGTLRIVHLETGVVVSEQTIPPEQEGIVAPHPYWMAVLEDLDFIQRQAKVLFTLPETITKDEADKIQETAFLLRAGRAECQQSWSVSVQRRHLEAFFADWKPGIAKSFTLEAHESREILGSHVEMGPTVFACARARIPLDEAQRVTDLAGGLADHETIQIKVQADEDCPATVEYSKWLPAREQTAQPPATEASEP